MTHFHNSSLRTTLTLTSGTKNISVVQPEMFSPWHYTTHSGCVLVAVKQVAAVLAIVRCRAGILSVSDFFPPAATQPIVGVYFTALYRALAS